MPGILRVLVLAFCAAQGFGLQLDAQGKQRQEIAKGALARIEHHMRETGIPAMSVSAGLAALQSDYFPRFAALEVPNSEPTAMPVSLYSRAHKPNPTIAPADESCLVKFKKYASRCVFIAGALKQDSYLKSRDANDIVFLQVMQNHRSRLSSGVRAIDPILAKKRCPGSGSTCDPGSSGVIGLQLSDDGDEEGDDGPKVMIKQADEEDPPSSPKEPDTLPKAPMMPKDISGPAAKEECEMYGCCWGPVSAMPYVSKDKVRKPCYSAQGAVNTFKLDPDAPQFDLRGWDDPGDLDIGESSMLSPTTGSVQPSKLCRDLVVGWHDKCIK